MDLDLGKYLVGKWRTYGAATLVKRTKEVIRFCHLPMNVNHERGASGEQFASILSHGGEIITNHRTGSTPVSPRVPPAHLRGVHGRVHEEVEYLFVVDFHVRDGHTEGGFDPGIDLLEHVCQCSGRNAAVLWFRLHDDRERAQRGGREQIRQVQSDWLRFTIGWLMLTLPSVQRRNVRTTRFKPLGFDEHGFPTCFVLFPVTSCFGRGRNSHAFEKLWRVALREVRAWGGSRPWFKQIAFLTDGSNLLGPIFWNMSSEILRFRTRRIAYRLSARGQAAQKNDSGISSEVPPGNSLNLQTS